MLINKEYHMLTNILRNVIHMTFGSRLLFCFPHYNKNHKGIWFHTNRVYNKDFEYKKMRRMQDFLMKILRRRQNYGTNCAAGKIFLTES